MRETGLWTFHIFAGTVILLLLGLHMIIMHLDSVLGWFLVSDSSTLDWENVIARSRMILFVIVYTLLLGTALFHGLYGFRSILFELNPAPVLKKLINIVFILVGLGLFAVGTAATIAIKIQVMQG
ncbi:MAG: hypothetical protein ABIA63_04930 [bacterium]